MADDMATRGDLAYALYSAMGLTTPTSTGRFNDGGYLDGITSTLADMGITNGISPTAFGTMNVTTRGEAFTMIARALGLADASTSIADASQALVNAGIVKGYGNDPNNLGLDDQLKDDHLKLLIERVTPQFNAVDPNTGMTIGEAAYAKAAATAPAAANARAQNSVAGVDPTFAAFLAASGVNEENVRAAMKMREDAYKAAQADRTEAYGAQADNARRGISQDFENRGFFRSGTRGQAILDSSAKIEMARKHAADEATRAYEAAQASDQSKLDDILGERAVAEAAARAREGEYDIGSSY